MPQARIANYPRGLYIAAALALSHHPCNACCCTTFESSRACSRHAVSCCMLYVVPTNDSPPTRPQCHHCPILNCATEIHFLCDQPLSGDLSKSASSEQGLFLLHAQSPRSPRARDRVSDLVCEIAPLRLDGSLQTTCLIPGQLSSRSLTIRRRRQQSISPAQPESISIAARVTIVLPHSAG